MPPKKNSVKPIPGGNAQKHWQFTLNNPTVDKAVLHSSLEPYVRYAIIADEVGESGTPHFQGYLCLVKKARRSSVTKIFGGFKPHLEQIKGTPKQNIAYCKKGTQSKEEWDALGPLGPNYGKDASFVESASQDGIIKNKKVNVRDQICDDLIAGASLREVALKHKGSYLSVYRGIERYQQLIQPDARVYRPDLECILLFGRTGTGKTHYALLTNPGTFRKPVGKALWFDNIPFGCKSVCFDECNGQYPLEDLLQITDRFQVQVQVKYGHAYLDVDTIFFTCNKHPAKWYPDKIHEVPWYGREEQRDAFFRRFTKVVFFKSADDITELTTLEERNDFFYHPEKYTYAVGSFGAAPVPKSITDELFDDQ